MNQEGPSQGPSLRWNPALGLSWGDERPIEGRESAFLCLTNRYTGQASTWGCHHPCQDFSKKKKKKKKKEKEEQKKREREMQGTDFKHTL